MNRLLLGLVVWLCVFTSPRAARAELRTIDLRGQRSGTGPKSGHKSSFSRSAIFGQLYAGFATPVGLLGVTGFYAPHERIALGAGIGLGPGGVQTAAIARTRPFIWERPRRSLAIASQLSFSTGRYRTMPSIFVGTLSEGDDRRPPYWVSERAYWLQLDVGFELRARTGFMLYAGPGVAFSLNPRDFVCKSGDFPDAACRSRPAVLPTINVGVGGG